LVRHRWGSLSVFLELGATAVGAQAAAEDAEEEGAADSGCEADDEGEVALDPGGDFFADGAAFADTVTALTSTGTTCSVKEVLLDSIASSSEFWACAADHAVAVVAGIRVVALCVATHDGLALHVSARALSGSAAEAIATV